MIVYLVAAGLIILTLWHTVCFYLYQWYLTIVNANCWKKYGKKNHE